jgi:hypothetical protein
MFFVFHISNPKTSELYCVNAVLKIVQYSIALYLTCSSNSLLQWDLKLH